MRRLPRDVRYDAWCRRCPRCDYDLAGLPEECQCPECGLAIGPGLRSTKVWWLEPPSYVQFAAMAIMAVLTTLAFVSAALRQASVCGLLVIGVFAFGFASGAFVSLQKLRHKAAGTTDTTLHLSPESVSLSHGGRVWTHEWSEVARIRLPRTLGRQRTILLKGARRWWLLGRRSTLLKVVAPLNRRELALLRNTMRRLRKRAGGGG